MDFLRPYTPHLLSVLRIMSGLLVLQHGTTKYLNFPAGPMNNASPLTMSGAAGLFELVFGSWSSAFSPGPRPFSCPA
jgi:putative oxidoreductase